VQALNQRERTPLSVADQVTSIYAGTGGYLDRIKTERVSHFLDDLVSRLHSEQSDLLKRIEGEGELSDEDEEALGKAIAEMIDDFGPDFDEEGNPLEEGESDRIRSEEERERRGRTAEEESEEKAAEREGEEAERTVEEAERETEEAGEEREKEEAPA
jgi:F-type H+-transporting ATPase subunit alpha